MPGNQKSEQGSTAIENLRYLASRKEFDHSELEQCSGLLGLVTQGRDLPGQEAVAELERLLRKVVVEARGRRLAAVQNGEAPKRVTTDARTAAAAELLSLSDDADLDQIHRLVVTNDRLQSSWETNRAAATTPKRLRQLKSALWLGETSDRRTRSEHDELPLLEAFETALREELRPAASQPFLAADASDSLNANDGQATRDGHVPAPDTRSSERGVLPPTPFGKPRRFFRRPLGVIVACIIVVAGSVVGVELLHSPSHQAPTGPFGTVAANTPQPAQTGAPPIQVEAVTPLATDMPLLPSGTFVLPQKLVMSPSELSQFGNVIDLSTAAFDSWYLSHGGAAVDFGYTSFTLRGNAKDQVRVTDMHINKQCTKPYTGTFFYGYSQGLAGNIGLAFNLDEATPVAQQMTTADEIPTDPANFFTLHSITLNPGETQTVSISAYTKQYACSFTIDMTVATAEGTFTQTINDNGKPFVVVAQAPPTAPRAIFSGYQALYVSKSWNMLPNGAPDSGWGEQNPTTFTGPDGSCLLCEENSQ